MDSALNNSLVRSHPTIRACWLEEVPAAVAELQPADVAAAAAALAAAVVAVLEVYRDSRTSDAMVTAVLTVARQPEAVGAAFVKALVPQVLAATGGAKPAAHLLKYDSILGTFKSDVKVVDDATISVDGDVIKVVSDRDPLNLPWKEMGIDIVIEGTGVFLDGPGAGKHIQAGAKKVVITAPAKGSDIPTYVVGVNADQYDNSANIVSNASCTTNCLAPFAKVIDDKFGIVKGTMTTTHSYTGDQRILDASHRDLRRARAAALNIVPTSTGAAKAVALVLPQLKGKLNGIALRVPTPNVSVVDLVVNVEKKGVTAEEVNAAFKEAQDGPMKGVLAITDVPLVSVDFRCTDVSTTIDAALTMVMGDDMVKVVAWYDNEWGYTQRVVDLSLIVANGLINEGVASADPMDQLCADDPSADECKVFD